MICKFSVHATDGDAAPAHLRALVADLRSWREYYVEFGDEPDDATLDAIAAAVGDPVIHTVARDVPLDADTVQVTYKRGIVDNENDSIVTLCRLLGADARWAKVATAYASAAPGFADHHHPALAGQDELAGANEIAVDPLQQLFDRLELEADGPPGGLDQLIGLIHSVVVGRPRGKAAIITGKWRTLILESCALALRLAPLGRLHLGRVEWPMI